MHSKYLFYYGKTVKMGVANKNEKNEKKYNQNVKSLIYLEIAVDKLLAGCYLNFIEISTRLK